MTLKAAFDQLAAWTVTGVTVYGLDDWIGIPPESDLPVLLPRLGGTGGEVLRPLGIQGDQGRFVCHVDHLLIVNGLGIGANNETYYGALTHIDNYLAAVVDDLDLGGNLAEPLTIADTSIGPHEIGGCLFWGIVFRHRWVLRIT